MASTASTVISMRLPVATTARLKRVARQHGWTPSGASARLVEEGLRRAEFAFVDFRDSSVGRQAFVQGSTMAVWEVVLLVASHKGNASAVARHLGWPLTKVLAAMHYAEAFPDEIENALRENAETDLLALKRMLPQTVEFSTKRAKR